MRIAVVGVCGSGKTTLVNNLRYAGIDAFNVAQEHSGIKKLWQKNKPDVLIMLDAKLSTIQKRRQIFWGEERLLVQRERLRDARLNADLFIATDDLTKEEVVERVLAFIR